MAGPEETQRLEAPKPESQEPDAPQQGVEAPRGAQVGRYVVLKAVGQGGMGVVYAAYDPELDRKVALKLLRADTKLPDPEAGRLRLLREAQAMARVSHPNVCAVFDVGTFEDQVFVAMEFIEGPTLAKWLTPERSWREVLRLFVEAGRGLVAAHEVGLVHRDFKPANVLVGKGDRPFVTDFGLARLVGDTEPAPGGESSSEDSLSGEMSVNRSLVSTSMTQDGKVVGTPNYMPPEQHRDKALLDARSDQFSFCAALYWALYKKRPFNPTKMAKAVRRQLKDGSAQHFADVIQEPPREVSVPAWVRRAVMRGLSPDPEARFPSMKELLEELSQEPRRVRRRWAMVAVGASLALVSAVGVVLQRKSQVCAGADQIVASAWNAQVRGRLEESFKATGKPFALDAAQGVSKVLDRYARDWARQHTEACEATRVQGVQTEELLSLRVVCLERRRKDLRAVAELLTQADAKLVERALDAVHDLPALQECQDIESLANQVALPTDPARRAEIEQLGEKMAEVKALNDAGRYKVALERAKELEPRVVATGYLPLQAELRLQSGVLKQRLGEKESGLSQLEQALVDAEAGRADRAKVAVLNRLVFLHADLGHEESAGLWGRMANATLARVGGDKLLASEILGNLGNVAIRKSRYAEARDYFEKARALQEPLLEPGDPRRAKTLYSLGVAAQGMEDKQRAVTLLKEALQQTEAGKGKEHPETARRHYALSEALRAVGDYAQALVHAQAALAIRKVSLGETHADVMDSMDAVGECLIKLERYEEARKTFEAAVALKEENLGPEDSLLSYSYDGLGKALLAAGRPSEAVAPLEKALGYADVEPEALADSGFTLAKALWEAKLDRTRALEVATQARQRYSEAHQQAKVAEVDAWLTAARQDVGPVEKTRPQRPPRRKSTRL
jgi:tetratricopeptide (TPR) repeat protein/predicted Ser/Thr protein kinase